MFSTKAARLFLFAAFLATALLGASAQTVQTLSGDWKYLPYSGEGDMSSPKMDDANWPSMSLPSNWFLLGSKAYPTHAKAGAGEVASNATGAMSNFDKDAGLDYAGTMWYRREVKWEGAINKPIILDLDMVDYYADVFVNGKKLGSHEGYFQKWSVDVTSAMKQGRNVIALKVSAPTMAFDMTQTFPISWPKSQNQVKGIFAYHDTRPGATSARGQERSTGGIIRGIQLRQSEGVDIVNVQVLPIDVSEKSAVLKIETTVRNWTGKPGKVSLAGEITPSNFKSDARIPYAATLTAAPGISKVTTEVRVQNPALWWTWDYGKPNLYQMKVTASKGAAVLDAQTVRFGIRSISHDNDWVWHLNGKRIYQRGSNYISTQWLSQADKTWYDRDVRMMVEANLNSIRIHAHLERPEFYEAADEQGVMVWQDFPLQWGYTDYPPFHEEALRQAGDMVARYADYPSIIVWCMHNESPHAMGWMAKRDPKQNLELDNKLVALVAKLDPSRTAHRDSGTGDGHTYPGWYGGKVGDYSNQKWDSKFMTEYGAQALPNLETLKETFQANVLFPKDDHDFDIWKFANFQPQETFKDAGVVKGATIEEFIHNSQLYQAQVVRFGTENFRRTKYAKSTGVYHFMFVEDWPSITWAVVDYYRRPKLGYTAMQASMQPILPSIEYQIDDPQKPISLWVVNDTYTDLKGSNLCWKLGTAERTCKTVDAGADSVAKIAELGVLPQISSGAQRLEVWIEQGGKVLGRNTLTADDFIVKKSVEVTSK